ncbi:enoyl-CoA hydratase/isomerase family protein [Streptomyces bambusae]|uniref:enoyl-CoA hydratase/isomerase family protein n=1 Tax=Streptomyces bambusae TaxID=1550616 RepID=UPI001D00104D|nr:enoyl-CoA hydratase/isomerase family protein [Streptomyces bambusae]MCB5169409.1 enoyl-CoA hydratase/isomerase family protein [Streptomyces bambusae]
MSVLIRTAGAIGRITLDRPGALNALTHDMVRRIHAALDDWEQDPAVRVVLLDGAGERGLCAGGDIRAIRESALVDRSLALAFWRDEYHLNARIARLGKPWVALMDGIVMGGGVGLSAHGSVRIVTERSRVAMPEVGIGFVPDVGGTYLLGRAPGELGVHLALTADAMTGADAVACGFADRLVPSERLPELVGALVAGVSAEEAAASVAVPAGDGELARHREWIDRCYGAETVEEIVERLDGYGEPAAKEAAARILGHSPTAVKVTLAAVRRARALGSLEEVLEQEWRVSAAALAGPDLPEGVRAQVVDKDRRPRWSPASLAEVPDAAVAAHFAPAGAGLFEG